MGRGEGGGASQVIPPQRGERRKSKWYPPLGRHWGRVGVRVTTSLKPIFHWAFISRVGSYNTIHFALGAFQIFFFTNKNIIFLKAFA